MTRAFFLIGIALLASLAAVSAGFAASKVIVSGAADAVPLLEAKLSQLRAWRDRGAGTRGDRFCGR